MLVIEETHTVIGRKVADFEALSRDVWMPALAQSDDCRLLWFFHLFTVYDAFGYVTITALRDDAAYEKHAERLQSGDLAEPAERLDACRYDVTSRIMTELPFAPLQVDLADVPTTPNDATPAVYMEDTMYPIVGQLRPFEHALETIYFRRVGHLLAAHHRGGLPICTGRGQPSRGDPAREVAGPLVAHQVDRPRWRCCAGTEARHLDARGAELPRPVEEPPAHHVALVAAPMTGRS